MLFQIEMASSYTQTTHTHTPHKADILATYVLKSPGLGQAERVTYVLRARTRYPICHTASQSVHGWFSLSSHTAIRIPAHSKSHWWMLDMKSSGQPKGCMLCDHPNPDDSPTRASSSARSLLARTSWSESWNEWMHTYIHSIAPSEYFNVFRGYHG